MSIIRWKMLAPFHYAFVQRGVLEVLLLSVGAGLLGTWIVMRGLAFYSHAVATAAFPGLVLADGLGFSAPLGAFAAAALFALGVERLASGIDWESPDAAAYFQRLLQKQGIEKELRRLGVSDGDTVRIGAKELEWTEGGPR